MTSIPAGKATVTPYIVAHGADVFLTFIEKAFDADVYLRVPNPDGSIGHAEAKIGSSVLMTFDASPDWPATPSFLSAYVDDMDATIDRAVTAGAAIVTDVMESAITGDRGGRLRDPIGNVWWVQTHQRDVSQSEMQTAFGDHNELTKIRSAQDSFDTEMRSRRIG